MFRCYIWPGASDGPVGHPVLVGYGAAHDVVANGSGRVAFLGVRAGVAEDPQVQATDRPSLSGSQATPTPPK
jgi:hypothetical protein